MPSVGKHRRTGIHYSLRDVMLLFFFSLKISDQHVATSTFFITDPTPILNIL